MTSISKSRSRGEAQQVGAPVDACPAGAGSSRRSRRVFVDRLEIMASVGVFEVEHRYEQRVVVSLDLDVDDVYDGVSERLQDVVDYSEVVRTTERIAQSRHYKLIETLAEDVAAACLRDGRIETVRVRIEKPDIMPNCRSVGIEIVRFR
jgi:dihydroneopterin aldolase